MLPESSAASSGDRPRCVVTGATGYIGARLVPRLLAAGHPVRCVVRTPRKLADRPWFRDPRVEIVECALDDEVRLATVMAGCGPAYYLVHGMMAGADYAARDRTMARTFARAAAAAGISRLLYLGGLGETGGRLSEHLASRREVERELASGAVPLTTFRAAMIIGSGSASFEILRYLVERLPIMVTPRWVSTECQPIAVRNVLHYLVAALDTPATSGRTLDIGGPDILSYRDIMHVMAAERGLRRRIILPVQVLTPTLSSLWIHLVTPLSHRIARPLAEGLRNRVVCRDDAAAWLMPQRLLPVREAIRTALDLERKASVESSWSAAGPVPGDPDWAGGAVYVDERSVIVHASPASTFAAVCRLGGPEGWHRGNWLWRVRGWIDRMAGGPGLRRGRRHPQQLSFGEALDFWRVTAVEPGARLTLRAEMRLPGEAVLDFAIAPIASAPDTPMPHSGAACRLTQTARFLPRGLAGLLYWWAVKPFHTVVFDGMLRGIVRTAERPPD